jgi:hypothetical protein
LGLGWKRRFQKGGDAGFGETICSGEGRKRKSRDVASPAWNASPRPNSLPNSESAPIPSWLTILFAASSNSKGLGFQMNQASWILAASQTNDVLIENIEEIDCVSV